MATLCELADEQGLERKDLSLEAWEAGHRPERLFSNWKTTVPEPSKRQKLLIDDDVLVDLFERLADDEREQRIAFRFVLGLILLRKRRMRFIERSRDTEGVASWTLKYRGAPDAPSVKVVDPELSDEDVHELTEQLGEILQAEL
jgi:hypothetical protein